MVFIKWRIELYNSMYNKWQYSKTEQNYNGNGL